MENFIVQEMDALGADGVEFVPILSDYSRPYQIIASFTRSEMQRQAYWPKSGRRYWKWSPEGNGAKIYLD